MPLRRIVAIGVFLSGLSLAGCEDRSHPTGPTTPTASGPLNRSVGTASAAESSSNASTTVAQILANPEEFLGQEVDLQGTLVEPFPTGEFLFSDSTGSIPADFGAASPAPSLNVLIRILGTVSPGIVGGFAVKVAVISWETAPGFDCDDLIEARARFTDPGFSFGNVVGLYLAYRGAPPGEKTVEITWDQHNPAGTVQTIAVGEGRPGEDGLFDLEGVVAHEYNNVKGTEVKNVRAVLFIEGREGSCTRARDVTVTSGSGPGSAGGGTLQVSIDEGEMVRSGAVFSVRAKISNQTPQTRDVDVVFQTPNRARIAETPGSGCSVLGAELIECTVTLRGGEVITRVVRYRAPEVTASTSITGAVTLVSGQFAPVVDYRVTVVP
ncbi:MAG TPA: hypothetical protein VEK15_21685 [Vicinamibacteria bacterium]|nr:hypothetical protein [Vicinamibacteria bacterium]